MARVGFRFAAGLASMSARPVPFGLATSPKSRGCAGPTRSSTRSFGRGRRAVSPWSHREPGFRAPMAWQIRSVTARQRRNTLHASAKKGRGVVHDFGADFPVTKRR